MADRYFDKFPIVTYSNTSAVDLTVRTAMLDKVISNPYVYYPYEIDSNERADQLSARYYDDQYKSWMIYLSNKILDPYYEWYLSQDEFVNFITKKYGSYYDAQTKIKYYENNWENGENISVSRYDSLTAGEKNYFEPIIGASNKITGYKRKQIDWKTNTNRVVAYTVSNTNFVVDEVCNIFFDQYNSGKGQVLSVAADSANTANSTVYVHHISGTYYTSNTVAVVNNISYIYGSESKVNTYFTSVVITSNNIPVGEEIYWNPVTYLDYETSRNEFNKTINVLDSNLKDTMVENLKDLLRE